jgi:hypothetical protein
MHRRGRMDVPGVMVVMMVGVVVIVIRHAYCYNITLRRSPVA